MIVSKEMVSKVKRNFGLNMYEARLWLALIGKGISTAGELSELGNVPRSRTYDVLDSLEKKGLISVKRNTRPLKYIAIPIEEAIENSKHHVKKVADKKREQINRLEGEMELLSQIFADSEKKTESTEKVGVLKSRENIMHHTSGMIRSARKSLNIAAPAEELSFIVEHQFDKLDEARKRGVEITLITDGQVPPHLSEIASVRMSNQPKRMVMVDGRETLFMLFPHGEMHDMYDAGLWVTSPYFTNAISSLLSHTA